jgi:hypothetical protein
MIRRGAWLLALLLGCGRPAVQLAPVADHPTMGEADAGATERDAGANGCVQECVGRNQMRAVGIEVIEDDCRRQCLAR